MKRGNTALKRGVGLASAFALAIAGAVVAAPAASAFDDGGSAVTASSAIRAIPTADAPLVTSGYPADYSAAGTTGAVPSVNISGTYQRASGIQILLPTSASGVPLWEADDVLTVTLGTSDGASAPAGDDVTFSAVPSKISVDKQSYKSADFDVHAGYAKDSTATKAGNGGGALTSNTLSNATASKPKVTDNVLTIPLPDPAVTGAAAGDTYLLTVDGIVLSVDKDFAPTDNLAVAATVAGVGGNDWANGGTTTIAYVNKFALSTKGDTTVTNNTVTLPTVYVSEAEESQFDSTGSSFTVSVTGTDVDSTHSLGFVDNNPKGVGSSAVDVTGVDVTTAPTDAVVSYTGASDTKSETIAISGLKVENVKAGTELTLTITNPAGNAANYKAAFAAADDSTLSFTPDQENAGSVTLKPADLLPRIAGSSRYATAADIAEKLGVSDAVIIANGENNKQGIDALSANFLAGVEDAPILLTQSDTLPDATKDALTELFKDSGADVTVYYMGKTDSVSQDVRDQVEATIKATLNPVGTVTAKQIAGDDRYATSVAAASTPSASEIGSYDLGEGFLRTAFLASGLNNSDALAAGALSATARIPVLLTNDADDLPKSVSDAIDDLHIGQIVILGGTDRVSQAVEDALSDAGVNVIRKAGSDRFVTATLIAELGVNVSPKGTGASSTASNAFLANGITGWPDALTAGPYVGSTGVLLTISDSNTLPAATSAFLKDTDTLTSIMGLGGTDRVTDAAITAAQDAIK